MFIVFFVSNVLFIIFGDIRTYYNNKMMVFYFADIFIMDHLYRLTTQNPLSMFVSKYMMTCPGGNCSGHGECQNGTCFCEVS